MSNGEQTIQLGDKSYHLHPQRIGFLRRRFKDFLANVNTEELDTGATDVVAVLGGQVHKALRIFIPDLMPDHEFQGYPTPESMVPIEVDGELVVPDPDPETDRSPTVPEIRNAFSACIEVNGFDIFAHLKGVVGTDFLGVYARKAMADFLASRAD